MESFNLDIFNFKFIDVVDILLATLFIYYIYSLIKNTIAANVAIGLGVIFLIWQLIIFFKLVLLERILGALMSVGTVALIIVFQQEIRRFLIHIGKNATLQRSKFWVKRLMGTSLDMENSHLGLIKPILDACKTIKKTRAGALIVFAKYYEEQLFFESGSEMIDAQISKRLLESVFQKNSPLHDGAVVIANQRIKMASCILPLSDNQKLPPQLGLRHRAGIGVTEQHDVLALIISEETGEISYACEGKIRMHVGWADLEKIIGRYI